MKYLLLLSVILANCQNGSMASPAFSYESSLKLYDLTWKQMPTSWRDGPFLGNGMIGTQIYKIDDRQIRICVQRGDYTDHRTEADLQDVDMYAYPRLPIGYFTLETAGKIIDCNLRLSLWDAELSGTIRTEGGDIAIRALVPTGQQAIIVNIHPERGETNARFEWHALKAVSPRRTWDLQMISSGDTNEAWTRGLKLPYPMPPDPVEREYGETRICYQKLTCDGDMTTAWREVRHLGGARTLYICPMDIYPESKSEPIALENLEKVSKKNLSEVVETHRKWWHQFYPVSFVNIPDDFWEGFYWRQMYKIASATRADGMLVDNQGPWLQETPWPGAWFNLNVQLAYWCVQPSGHLDLGESLFSRLDRNFERLVKNMPPDLQSDSAGLMTAVGQNFESGPVPRDCLGMLTWVCHNYWLQYRFSMDDQRLRDHLYPLLRRSINHYLHVLEPGPDGKLHLPPAWSPEYPINGWPRDCNFQLAQLRWGLQTLLRICDRLKIEDPQIAQWKETLNRLVNFQVDEHGFMIGKDLPLTIQHRHYSHLKMIYPLYLVNIDNPDNRDLMKKSVDWWINQADDHLGGYAGYSYTGASSIYASMGDGNKALFYLDKLKGFLLPNTLYKESGPVIETPLSAAQCIHDMLIQSWGDRIRVFPAVPDKWADVSFGNLRTEGAFLVSAVRSAGETTMIQITSLAGEPCHLQTDMCDPVAADGSGVKIHPESGGVYFISLKKGEQIVLIPRSKTQLKK